MHLQKKREQTLGYMRYIPVTVSIHLHYLQYRGNTA